jgi:hypothetical protein
MAVYSEEPQAARAWAVERALAEAVRWIEAQEGER